MKVQSKVRGAVRALCAVSLGAFVCASGSEAFGHGFPIEIGVDAGRIAVGNGLTLTGGYSNWGFDRAGGTGDDQFELGLFATAPGFEWTTFPPTTQLTLEVIGRPDFSSATHPMRWLWHWDQAAQAVDAATASAKMDIFEIFAEPLQSASFSQFTAPNDATVPVTFVSGEHDLLLYQLTDPAPRFGLYGFFARLTAPGFQGSEPFVIAFAYGVGTEEFAEGIASINAAAGLAGDYNVDGAVDGDDLLVWQKTLGMATPGGGFPAADGSLDRAVNAADLAVWRRDYGKVVVYPPAGTPGATGVPEPSGLALAAVAIAAAALRRPRLRTGFRG